MPVLFVFSAVWFVSAWAAAEILIVEKPLEKADAIFVLGGGSTFVERTAKAAELFRAGKAQKIILTNDNQRGGWSAAEERNPFYWELAHRELTAQGVPSGAIEILPEIVNGTGDEAILFAKTAKKREWNSILLVTSGFHTRRALWIFQKTAAENDVRVELGIESPNAELETLPPALWWLSPRGWRNVAGEYLKFGYYWLFY